MTGVFADSCGDYALAGWPCVIPVPAESKFPPPEGFTGAAGRDTPPEQLAAWAGSVYAGYSVALRMPDGVLGLDIDHYEKNGSSKRGADTLAELEKRWGALPPTWCSTARGADSGPGPARILFFRVPPGRYTTKLGPDIDVIQHHHRYAVVAPSPHPGTGTAYRWYSPDGQPTHRVPAPADLAGLPPAWTAGLAEGATSAGPMAASVDSGQTMLSLLHADRRQTCAEMDKAGQAASAQLQGTLPGSRHDVTTGHVYRIVQLGAEGHPGAGYVLNWLEDYWDTLTAGENREAEFASMELTAARKAVTLSDGPGPAVSDPCLTERMLGWDAPAPADGGLRPADMLEPPQAWSPREAWGAHLFMTDGQLDSVLARDILGRVYPGLRYAADACTWLVRGPLTWGARKGEQARWAVEEMFWLLPLGSPDAPEGTDPYFQAKRRARFGTQAGANAIAGKMTAQVSAGHHPCALDMKDLDQEQEILWAGGTAWDLRASANRPVAAGLDPGTPHMHTAACLPEVRPTPLWNAFTAAVWPDEGMRRWALRVMAIAFTGHPDKALPILLGATDRGKTELINLLMSVLGTYALKSADARLLNAADRSHASIVYALKGCRLAFIDEAPRAGYLAQERLKQLTGGASLTGNRMGENPITFTPTHTLVLTANPDHEPVLTDPAIRRRVRLLPCDGDPREIRAARAAIGFLSQPAWRGEAPGVLALMMGEAAAWLADPLTADNRTAPPQAQRAAEQIMLMQDVTGTWVSEETEPFLPGTRARQLYKNFVVSCRERGMMPGQFPTETAWGRRLSELGFAPTDKRDGRYRPLRVRAGGGFTPAVEGPMDSYPPTLHTDNPRSDLPQLSTVESVDSKHTHNAHNTHTHPHICKEGDEKLSALSIHPQTPGQAVFAGEKPPTNQPPTPNAGSLAVDLETGSADDLFTYTQRDDRGFVRLAGALGQAGQVTLTDGHSLLPLLDAAAVIHGHNVLGYDLVALAWHHGADYDRLAAKARDTELIARQLDPPRSRESGTSTDRFDLDHVAQRLGVPGKAGDLAALKRKYHGYDQIPLDDPEYVSYLEGDLRATAGVAARLGEYYDRDPYLHREHQLAALAGRMTLNGFLVDQPLLDQRAAGTAERSKAALQKLHDVFGLPLGKMVMRGRGKARHEEFMAQDSPLSTDSGRDWLAGIWAQFGVADPPRTEKAGKLSVGADELRAVAARRPELAGLCETIVTAAWPRTVYQTALDCLAADGRVHPSVSFRQASGRWSVTNPGLTVFGKRGGRHVERDIFTADPGHVLLSFDLSQVDMRAMAGHSQDRGYMDMFAPGRDAHAEIGAQVGLDRQAAKMVGHGWNYGLSAARMIREGMDPVMVNTFVAGMQERFPRLIAWREEIRAMGKAGQILDNGFGRRMRCDPARAFTVAPALLGQGGARDIMCESLLHLPREFWPMLRTMVHDEILLSVPKADAVEVANTVMAAMTWEWRGVPILCDMAVGMSWGECSAK